MKRANRLMLVIGAAQASVSFVAVLAVGSFGTATALIAPANANG